MNFRPELAEKVMRGEKTVTRRRCSGNPQSPWSLWGCGLKIGRDYAVCPGRGKHAIGRVRILEVSRGPVGWIGDFEAEREGFANEAEFIEAWQEINGSFDPRSEVWRVAFEVVAAETEAMADAA